MNRQVTGETLGFGVWLIIITAILLLVGTIASFAFGWIALPFQKGSVQNVETQFAKGYDMYESLVATAQSVCIAEKSVEAAESEAERTSRRTNQMAYESNYSRIAADYDAWSRDVFRGQVIRPADLPTRAPSLSQMKAAECD